MKYLNKKSDVTLVTVGDAVLFLADCGDATVGTQGVITGSDVNGITVQLAPKTTYEQENASLRTSVTVLDLNILAFGEDLQVTESVPVNETVEEPVEDEEVTEPEVVDEEVTEPTPEVAQSNDELTESEVTESEVTESEVTETSSNVSETTE